MKITQLILVALTIILNSASIQASEFPEGLESFMTEHFKVLEAQDSVKAIENLHSKGKNRDKSIRDLETHLKQMPFKYSIISSQYIGKDEEFHYVRYRQQTLFDEKWKEMSGGKGIEMDIITIFGKEHGKWKIFDTYLFKQENIPNE